MSTHQRKNIDAKEGDRGQSKVAARGGFSLSKKTTILIIIPIAIAVVVFVTLTIEYVLVELPKQAERAKLKAEYGAELAKFRQGPAIGKPIPENPRLTNENYVRIVPGMSYDEVVLILGPPWRNKFSSKSHETWCSGGVPSSDETGWHEQPKAKIDIYFRSEGEKFVVQNSSQAGLK